MKVKIAVFFLLFIIISGCSKQKSIPEKLTERIVLNATDSLAFVESDSLNSLSTQFFRLQKNIQDYKNNNNDFNLDSLKNNWMIIETGADVNTFSEDDLRFWVEANGLLLELSGEAIYAEELEKIASISKKKNINLNDVISPFIYTKNVDHIHINLFEPFVYHYQHSLGGEVEISTENKIQESGEVNIQFKMTEKRYIELFVRIPSWAEGATVTVKKVKYFAAPGTYCQIAKKWKEGDVIEIHFPGY